MAQISLVCAEDAETESAVLSVDFTGIFRSNINTSSSFSNICVLQFHRQTSFSAGVQGG
jgi:hypothetical protein